MFGNTVEQKGHLRWQCVIVPSRSPVLACMQQTEVGKWEEWVEEEEKKKSVWDCLHRQKVL